MTAKYCVFQMNGRTRRAKRKNQRPYSCHRTKAAAKKAAARMLARIRRAHFGTDRWSLVKKTTASVRSMR